MKTALLLILKNYPRRTGGRLRSLLFLFLLLSQTFQSQAQDFIWAKGMGGGDSDIAYSVAVDAEGNVYTTGYFEGTADFDPGAGTFNLTSAGKDDIFVSKLDASGNFVWAKRIGGSSDDTGESIAVDADGDIYITGSFSETVDFDPSDAGVSELTSAASSVGGVTDVFVTKLSASGDFVWAKSMGGSSTDMGFSVAVDDSKNVYTTGRFSQTADFDPGAGTFELSSANNSDDIFVSKLSSSGDFVWAKRMGGTSDDRGLALAVDGSGNVYTTGYFGRTVDFDPGDGTFELTTAGNDDIFVSKLSASGDFVWAKRMGGSEKDRGESVALDDAGNVHITGYFTGTADFDPSESGTENLTSAGSRDIFVSKLSTSGNFVWAKRMGGDSFDVGGASVAVDASGNVYTTGTFTNTADFDPGNGVSNLTSKGTFDIFVSKLDASGNFVWVGQLGGGSVDQSFSIAVNATGTIYTTGYFMGQADFAPNEGVDELTSAGSGDIFVSKPGECPATYNVTGGGAYCANGTGVAVGLDGSESGVSYQLKVDDGNVSAETGTGSALNFGNQTTAGTYTVVATDQGSGCTVDMMGSAIVTVNALPTATVSGGGTVCEGETRPDVSIALTGKAPFTFTYSDGTNSTNVTTSDNPFVITEAAAGTYTVTALSDDNKCTGTFEVLDLQGVARQTQTKYLQEGLNKVQFRLGTLPTGVYLIRAVDALNRQGVVKVSKE